jgi:hypothetical protein
MQLCPNLLSATVNPGGQLGPLLTHFLRQAGHRPLTGIPCPASIWTLHSSPATTQLRALAHAILPKVGMFQKADLVWYLANPSTSS